METYRYPVCTENRHLEAVRPQHHGTASSLELLNAGVHQNNTESFAFALCHLAEFHAKQSCFVAAGEVLKHLKDRFPPNSQHAQKWMLWDQKIQFDRALNEGKFIGLIHLLQESQCLMA